MVQNKPVIKLALNIEVEYPQELIDGAPKSGPFDDYAEYICESYDVQADASIKEFLQDYGAWGSDELNDHEQNIKRVLWVTILNCKEEKTNFAYIGK